MAIFHERWDDKISPFYLKQNGWDKNYTGIIPAVSCLHHEKIARLLNSVMGTVLLLPAPILST
jgi:hypothetical protein